MATSPIKQLTTGQRIMGGIVVFKPAGSDKFVKFGPVGDVTFTPTLTEIDSRSDESGTSQLIGSWVTQSDAVLNIANIQMWTDILYDAQFLTEKFYLTQAAVPATTLTVEDVAVGDVIIVPGIKPTITSITDGAAEDPVTYTEDATGFGNGDYIYQQARGIVEFIKIPAGAGADAVVTYAQAAITEADKIVRRQIMSTAGVRGEVRILGVVDGGLPGAPVDYIFPDVQLRPNGDTTLKGVDAQNIGSLTGKVFNTGGVGYGFIQPVAS
ncbi:hypothetical protein ACS4RR_021010 [Rhizobium sp. Z1P35]